TLGYQYKLIYTRTSSFAQRGAGVSVTGNPDPARGDISFNRDYSRELKGNWDQRQQGLGGWSLSAHHAYDPRTQTIYPGDGPNQKALQVGLSAVSITRFSPPSPKPFAIAAAPDGAYFLVGGEFKPGQATNYRHVVSKLAPSGAVTIVAGIADGDPGYSGDNG